MNKDIVDIVMEKEFVELTEQERSELQEFCSTQEEYDQLKDVFTNVENMTFETVVPRQETKDRLDELFDQTYPKAAPMWYSSILTVLVPREKPIHRQPLMQIAAVALLFIMVVPLFRSDMTADATMLADNTNPTIENNSLDEELGTEQDEAQEQVAESDAETRSMEDSNRGTVAETLTAEADDEINGFGAGLALASSPAPVSTHPDGIFIGTLDTEVAYSQPASESADLLDLLTVTF
jgi:hypothetical protein